MKSCYSRRELLPPPPTTRFLIVVLTVVVVSCMIKGVVAATEAATTAASAVGPLLLRKFAVAAPSSIIPRIAQDLGKIGFYYGINLCDHVGKNSNNGAAAAAAAASSSSSSTNKNENRIVVDFQQIENDVEKWAESMLEDTNRDGSSLKPGSGWQPIQCNKALRKVFNPNGQTKQFVKWMVDSRGKHAATTTTTSAQATQAQQKLHPCMKLYAVIDAPFDIVCRYLSQEHRYREYNSLLINQCDIQEVSPHSKICWSQTKKLLFIQPRDFITFCSHKWRDSGNTQLIVNQACFDDDHVVRYNNSNNNGLRAYGLRGATFITRNNQDPKNRTTIILLAHCNCGNDVPEWAVRTAVKVLAPIKPFEIIHRINVGIHKSRKQLEQQEDELEATTTTTRPSHSPRQQQQQQQQQQRKDGRSTKPAGMAQMGYACFWPKGGGPVHH